MPSTQPRKNRFTISRLALGEFFADDDRAARIADRQPAQVGQSMKAELLQRGVARDDRAVDSAGAERAEPLGKAACLNDATSLSGARL